MLQAWVGFTSPAQDAPLGSNPTCTVRTPADPADRAAARTGGPVGLYEGGGNSPCGVFRPAPGCRMRYHELAFCPVCSWTLMARLGQYVVGFDATVAALNVGPATAAATYVDGADPRLLLYELVTGSYSILALVPLAQPLGLLSAPGAQILPGFTSLWPFQLGGRQCLLADSAPSGRRVLFRIDASAGPAILGRGWDSGVGGAVWTHSSVFLLGGAPHVFSYDARTGAIAVERIENENDAPTLVDGTGIDPTRRFRTGWTALTTLTAGDTPYVLTHDAGSGSVQMQSLTPSGRGPNTFVSKPRFWTGLPPVILPFSRGDTFILRTNPASQIGSIDVVRPNGSGVDAIVQAPVGAGVTQLLDCHFPAGTDGASGASDFIGVYGALSGSLRFLRTSTRPNQ